MEAVKKEAKTTNMKSHEMKGRELKEPEPPLRLTNLTLSNPADPPHPTDHEQENTAKRNPKSWTKSTENRTAGLVKKGGRQGRCEKMDVGGFEPGKAGIAAQKHRRGLRSWAGILDASLRGARNTGRAGIRAWIHAGVFILFMLIIMTETTLAADPGHGAASIGSGTFESGNYTLPDTLEILNTLNVSNGLLYVGSSGSVGVGTSSPTHKLNVEGAANVTGDVFLSTTGLASCSGKLITDSTGNITCGVDDGGSVGWDNVVFMNETLLNTTYLLVGQNATDWVVWTNVGFINDTVWNTTYLASADANSTYARLDDINNSYALNSSLSTYDTWAYNQTAPAISYADANFLTSVMLNASYLLTGENLSASAGMDYTNIAMTNQTNTFAAGYNQTFDTSTLFVDAESDRVGIGTTGPQGKLQITGNTLTDFWHSDSSQALDEKNWVWQSGSAVGAGIYRLRVVNDAVTNGNNAVEFNRTGITINSVSFPNGNVGIGTTNPDETLDVRADKTGPVMKLLNANTAGYSSIDFYNASGSQMGFVGYANPSAAVFPDGVYFGSNNKNIIVDSGTSLTVVKTLGGSGDVYVYANNVGALLKGGAYSDIRLKKDITPISEKIDILDAIRNIRGIYYHWNTSEELVKEYGDDWHVGLLAQELEKYVPELVTTNEKGIKGIHYPFLTAFLIEATRIQQEEIDELKAQIGGGNLTAVPYKTGVNGTVETVAGDSESPAAEENISELNQRVESLESEIALLKEEIAGMKKAGGPQTQKQETPPQELPSAPPEEVNLSNATDESQPATKQGGNGSELQNQPQGGEGITGMATAAARQGRGLLWRWISGLVGQSGRDG